MTAGQPIGLYIHVPFCVSKCPYCDFYSLSGQDDECKEAYTAAVVRSLETWQTRLRVQADTLYFGGGTPSLLGGNNIARILDAATRLYGLQKAEITMEANPGDALGDVLKAFAAVGGNRVSFGMQSSDAAELKGLGRRHTPLDVPAAVQSARAAGIENISLDMMLGIENQTIRSIEASAQTAHDLGARHVSAYLLKIEEGTPFYKNQAHMRLPDEDHMADMYLAACESLESLEYKQYEISNFAKAGYESRHNLKYWNGEPYLGIGPSAHSFLNGRRFYYPRSLKQFMTHAEPVPERKQSEEQSPEAIPDAGIEEYSMLRLRLTKGLTETDFANKFGVPIPAEYKKRAARLPNSLVITDENGIRFTRQGFLVSNPLIVEIVG